MPVAEHSRNCTQKGRSVMAGGNSQKGPGNTGGTSKGGTRDRAGRSGSVGDTTLGPNQRGTTAKERVSDRSGASESARQSIAKSGKGTQWSKAPKSNQSS